MQVLDRGAGMTEEVLRNALLPFYSTKPAGAGLGLTLCREVIEAHGGRISLANRPRRRAGGDAVDSERESEKSLERPHGLRVEPDGWIE